MSSSKLSGSSKFGLVLDDRLLAYHLGSSHPMNEKRILPAFRLFEEVFLDLNSDYFELVLPDPIDKETLMKAHDQMYIDTMEQLSREGSGFAPEYGLGTGDCPVFKGMAEASEFVVGSTVSSAEKIYHGKCNYSFVLLGGLHHARTAKASGFCYYNDINVAIHRLKSLKSDIRILYLDTDLHHGDGTQFDFYNDPNVLTVSFHESGQFLFPGTGFSSEVGEGEGMGSSVNMPFFPFTWDEMYLYQVKRVFPVMFETFQPDFVIWQAGVDGHQHDPLGHLQLTTNTYNRLGQLVRKLAEKNMDTPKVLALGGGGYNPDSVARSWAQIVSGLSNQPIPKRPSINWVEECHEIGIPVSYTLVEDPSEPHEERPEVVIEANKFYDEQFDEYLTPYFSV